MNSTSIINTTNISSTYNNESDTPLLGNLQASSKKYLSQEKNVVTQLRLFIKGLLNISQQGSLNSCNGKIILDYKMLFDILHLLSFAPDGLSYMPVYIVFNRDSSEFLEEPTYHPRVEGIYNTTDNKYFQVMNGKIHQLNPIFNPSNDVIFYHLNARLLRSIRPFYKEIPTENGIYRVHNEIDGIYLPNSTITKLFQNYINKGLFNLEVWSLSDYANYWSNYIDYMKYSSRNCRYLFGKNPILHSCFFQNQVADDAKLGKELINRIKSFLSKTTRREINNVTQYQQAFGILIRDLIIRGVSDFKNQLSLIEFKINLDVSNLTISKCNFDRCTLRGECINTTFIDCSFCSSDLENLKCKTVTFINCQIDNCTGFYSPTQFIYWLISNEVNLINTNTTFIRYSMDKVRYNISNFKNTLPPNFENQTIDNFSLRPQFDANVVTIKTECPITQDSAITLQNVCIMLISISNHNIIQVYAKTELEYWIEQGHNKLPGLEILIENAISLTFFDFNFYAKQKHV